MLNSLNFWVSVKLLICSSNLHELIIGYSHLGCRFFPFITLSISYHSLLACGVWLKYVLYSYGDPLICYLVLLCFCFNIFSLCLAFVHLVNVCLGVFLSGFILYGTRWASWMWVAIFLSQLREVLDYNLLRYFFILFFSSDIPLVQMLVHLMLS